MKKVHETDLLVIGGGAAGLCAAAEAAKAGAKVTVIESDLHAGGQLVKQTHKFFGSRDEYAGTRGFKIADILLDEIGALGDKVDIRLRRSEDYFIANPHIHIQRVHAFVFKTRTHSLLSSLLMIQAASSKIFGMSESE